MFDLYKAGALTQSEYNTEKQKILNEGQQVTPTQATVTPTQTPVMPFGVGGMEAFVVQQYNAQHGTNFKSISEISNSLQKK